MVSAPTSCPTGVVNGEVVCSPDHIQRGIESLFIISVHIFKLSVHTEKHSTSSQWRERGEWGERGKGRGERGEGRGERGEGRGERGEGRRERGDEREGRESYLSLLAVYFIISSQHCTCCEQLSP